METMVGCGGSANMSFERSVKEACAEIIPYVMATYLSIHISGIVQLSPPPNPTHMSRLDGRRDGCNNSSAVYIVPVIVAHKPYLM